MGYEDDRHPIAELVHDIVKMCLCWGIHVDRRFVEEEDLRVADEARAMITRCCSPPERFWICRSAKSVICNVSSASSALA